MVLLYQVIGELLSVMRHWESTGKLTRQQVHRYRRLFCRVFKLVLPTRAVIERASELFDRYSLSHWDSMLLAACIEAGVDTLYTEDMGAPRTIESVQLINPFTP